jgi:hypothetical protein
VPIPAIIALAWLATSVAAAAVLARFLRALRVPAPTSDEEEPGDRVTEVGGTAAAALAGRTAADRLSTTGSLVGGGDGRRSP